MERQLSGQPLMPSAAAAATGVGRQAGVRLGPGLSRPVHVPREGSRLAASRKPHRGSPLTKLLAEKHANEGESTGWRQRKSLLCRKKMIYVNELLPWPHRSGEAGQKAGWEGRSGSVSNCSVHGRGQRDPCLGFSTGTCSGLLHPGPSCWIQDCPGKGMESEKGHPCLAEASRTHPEEVLALSGEAVLTGV